MNWNSNRDAAIFAAVGMIAAGVAGVTSYLLFPDQGLGQLLRGIIPAAVGGILGVYMTGKMKQARINTSE